MPPGMPGTHPRQYLVSRGRNVISPKVCQNVIKLPAELMRSVQPAFAVLARRRDSQRKTDNPYFA